MRALIPSTDPEHLVEMAEVAEPEPADGEVVVAVESFSVNRGELQLVATRGGGWRPGQDVAGTITRTAAGAPPVGTRVVGQSVGGGWAERVVVPAAAVATLPDHVSAADASTLPVAGLTAVRLVRAAGPLLGTRVLITAASGGVGHFATQLAVQAGAEVTVVTRSPERGARLLELGATRLVHDLTVGHGGADGHGAGGAAEPYDVVLEAVGGETLAAAARLTRPGGLVLWFGQAGGEPTTLDFYDLTARTDLRIQVHVSYASADGRPDDLATLVRLVAEGRVQVEVGRRAHWEQTDRVLAELRDRKITGKAVLDVS